MNQVTAYELLIAQKLEELVVPDHADAIWATIEHQLNIEMPSNPSSGSGGSSGFNWWIGGSGLFTLFIGTLTYVYVARQNLIPSGQPKEKPAIIQPVQPKKTREEVIEYRIPSIENSNKDVPVDSAKETGIEVVNEVSSTQDSSASVTVPPQKNEVLAIPVKIDTAATKKKARGVKGIGDGDYRLVPGVKKNKE